jgi:acetyl-CoA carboxylase carboxyl transferase subunit beta
MIDRVVQRRHLREELGRILRLLMNQPPMIHGDLPPPTPPAVEPPPEEAAQGSTGSTA